MWSDNFIIKIRFVDNFDKADFLLYFCQNIKIKKIKIQKSRFDSAQRPVVIKRSVVLSVVEVSKCKILAFDSKNENLHKRKRPRQLAKCCKRGIGD